MAVGEVFSFGLGHFGVLGRSFTPYDHEPVGALDGMDGGDLENFGFVGEQQQQDQPPARLNANVNDDRDFDIAAHIEFITSIKLKDSGLKLILTFKASMTCTLMIKSSNLNR